MHSDEMPRGCYVGFQLLAQSNDVNVDGSRVWKRFVAPDRIQDLVARKRLVGILQEEGQEVVFSASEFQIFAAPLHNAVIQVDRNFGKRDYSVGVGRRAAQNG